MLEQLHRFVDEAKPEGPSHWFPLVLRERLQRSWSRMGMNTGLTRRELCVECSGQRGSGLAGVDVIHSHALIRERQLFAAIQPDQRAQQICPEAALANL
jgi:hypothetical protein